jgi:predicted nucleic acid-binding protein
VTNALYRYQKLGLLSEEATRLEQRAALPMSLHGELELHQCALQLAGRLRLPAAYDAHRLAVAEQLQAERSCGRPTGGWCAP